MVSLSLFFAMLGIAYYALSAVEYRQSISSEYSLLEREAYHAMNALYENVTRDSVFDSERLVALFNGTNVSQEYNLWSGYEITVTDASGGIVSVSGVSLSLTNGAPKREDSPTVVSERKGILQGAVATMRLRVWY